MEEDTEVRGDKRGRETGTNEDMSPLPKNRFAVLVDDDLKERPLVIDFDLDSQDLVMIPINIEPLNTIKCYLPFVTT
ncbi:hypothetical protein DPMN_130539 [Dreissena polymorpha]|uniref:Uncharacterized protein n=1 Tax=Dreissena polymorpha TaxID=45954 RepID=A0A9D4K1V0_DREPO|nr:hypothetical protein DPMN_130539 [Dreissena polymorpha]